MNRTTLRMLCVASFALYAASCAQGTATTTTGGSTPGGGASLTGGTIGSSGGTLSSSGGTTTIASGGSPQTGGNPVTGGNPLAGGNPVTGGVASSGGTTTGAGGTTTRSGGTISSSGGTISSSGGTATSSGGTTTSSGGTTTSSGGVTGTSTGGTTARTGGTTVSTGGTTTSTGGAGGSTTVDVASVVPDLDGFYWEGTCSGSVTATGRNCPFADATATTCPSGTTWATRGAIKNKTITVKGTTGTQYTINFEVRGVAGTRCYTGGAAASTATPSATGPNNTWYVGGTQASDSIWNTYEIHVSPAVPGEANVYYANSFSQNQSWCSKEATYQVGFTASFKVLGGGTITFTIHDANCMAQQNCGGNDTSSVCDSPRTIDLTGMSPAATFTQPPTNTIGTKTYNPQWLYFDVKSVTSP